MATSDELDRLRGALWTYVLTADEPALTNLGLCITPPNVQQPRPLPVQECEQLARELHAVVSILNKATEKFRTEPERHDVRRHRALVQQWIARLETFHVRSRLARFHQE